MVLQVEELPGLQLKRALGHCDQPLEEGNDLVAAEVGPGVVLVAGLVPAHFIGEERTDGVPVAPSPSRVQLADDSLVRLHVPILGRELRSGSGLALPHRGDHEGS
jgi:hypothetical protein